jgi:hypothetical protein
VALAELLAHAPGTLRDRCAPDVPVSGPYLHELARIRCQPSVDITLTISLFDTAEALDVAFDQAVSWAAVFGRLMGFTCQEGGFIGRWDVDGDEIGGALCFGVANEARITWTHEMARILATLRVPDADHARAWEVWLLSREVP